MDVEKPLLVNVWGGFARPSLGAMLLVLTILTVSWLHLTTKAVSPTWVVSDMTKSGIPSDPRSCSGFFRPSLGKKVVKSILDFGGVGDGITLNTEAFRRAIEDLKRYGDKGGSQLNIPKGRWVTGSFNLTSNFTLYLEEGAVLLGSQSPKEWPVIEALASYGRGRERLGGRHISLIHAHALTNLVITGENGTIDGQGRFWWELWWNRTLEYTRGHLLEMMNSRNILISNLTFLNSPFWTIHPVYSSNVVIKDVTILAPLNSPNTDGIDPDSSSNVCIENCYIESGDDLVAVKSGWDQYGIAMARPSSNIIVRNVSGTTPSCSGIGLGSEMSGGISNVTVENLHIRDSAAGVRVKTDRGRGGYITNITISNVTLERVKIPIRFSSGANDHPDDKWDPNALPVVKGIFINNVVGMGIGRAPVLEGIKDAHFEGICLNNVRLEGIPPPSKWHCEFVSGSAVDVSPAPCQEFQRNSTFSLCTRS